MHLAHSRFDLVEVLLARKQLGTDVRLLRGVCCLGEDIDPEEGQESQETEVLDLAFVHSDLVAKVLHLVQQLRGGCV